MKLFDDNQRQSRDKRQNRILKRCKEVISHIVPNSEVIVYGSCARGKMSIESDIDLLILVDGQVDWGLTNIIRGAIYDVSLEEDVVISVIVREKNLCMLPNWKVLPLYQNIEREGIIIR